MQVLLLLLLLLLQKHTCWQKQYSQAFTAAAAVEP
jgi:hypothetical protein